MKRGQYERVSNWIESFTDDPEKRPWRMKDDVVPVVYRRARQGSVIYSRGIFGEGITKVGLHSIIHRTARLSRLRKSPLTASVDQRRETNYVQSEQLRPSLPFSACARGIGILLRLRDY